MVSVARTMDDWVEQHKVARAGWVDGSRPREIVIAQRGEGPSAMNPIQQVRGEILGFAEVVLADPSIQRVLEIGLGQFGGTHMLWSLICEKVFTLDVDENVIDRFLKSEQLDFQQSCFFCGSSWNRDTYLQVARAVREVDLLFIDGDHLYEGVEADWRMYHHLVRPGGIVAFHDTRIDHLGEREVATFVENLERGSITGTPVEMQHIYDSMYVGISYYRTGDTPNRSKSAAG